MKKTMSSLSRIFALCPVLLLVVTTPLLAHEFWIEPKDWSPKVEKKLFGIFQGSATGELMLKVGTGFVGNSLPDIPPEQRRFDIIDPDNAVSPAGRGLGEDPAGRLVADRDGAWRAVFADTGKTLAMGRNEFLTYLQKSGLRAEADIISTRADTDRIKERFLRNATWLQLAGDASFPLKPAGLKLELLPLDDPRQLAVNAPLRLQLLWKGQPLAGRMVYALTRKGGSDHIAEAFTDANGIASLPVGKIGPVLISAIHMERAANSDEPYADQVEFISHWSSLTVNLN